MSKASSPFFVKSLPIGTIGDLLAGCAAMLESEGLPDAEREAREIFAAVLDVPRFWAAANSVANASPEVARSVVRAAILRAKGAPLAYAAGRAAFRHLTLDVDERVYATDISLDALDVAAANATSLAKVLKSPVEFRHGSLLAPLRGVKLDAVICNPPYISFAELVDLPPDVRDWEPSIALLSAGDGLAATRELVRTAPLQLARHGLLALEVDTRRAGSVAEMISVDGRYSDVEVLLDLTGRERFVLARRA